MTRYSTKRTTNNGRKALIAKIHIAKKDLGFDDGTYSDVLWRVTGKRSCKDMTSPELLNVLKDMESNGFKPKKAPSWGIKPNVKGSKALMIDKIEAMLAEDGKHWNYAHGIASQMFGVKRLQFLSEQNLHKVVQALSVQQKRNEKKAIKKDS